MVRLYNISDWYETRYFNTGGTRNKKVYVNPIDGEYYFFKESLKKGNRDYKYEFWSEVIASEIGELLGFNVLKYHIAIRGEVMGCISKSMINQASDELIEGGKYLQAFDPEDIRLRYQYDFDLIKRALDAFEKSNYLKELIEIIVFDALIGNSDRHQENWAIINSHTRISEGFAQIERDVTAGNLDGIPPWLGRIVSRVFTIKGKIRPELQTARLMLPKKTKFAPIYDSGCSFGRELDDERVRIMLERQEELERYVSKGLSEIHWERQKISHFNLIKNLLGTEEFRNTVLQSLKRVLERFDYKTIEKVVISVDKEIVDSGSNNILPKERKELVLKLLSLRMEKLGEIYSQYK
jgi:hypothetical protein